MKISPARSAAFEILDRIEHRGEQSAALLDTYERSLSSADRGLCHAIVLGVLRNRIRIDREIDLLARGRKIDPEIRNALRIGIFQIAFLDRVPAHAAVNESVNLVVRAKKKSAAGFVNAILRSRLRHAPEIEFSDDLDRISTQTSHPRGLIERWVARFGRENAVGIAEANNKAQGSEYRETFKTTDAVRNSLKFSGNSSDPAYLRDLAENGKIYFQDRGSQAVAEAIGLEPGESFLDVCASPGGKATLIALRAPESAVIVAGDISARRTAVLAANCRNQGADRVNVCRFDAIDLPFAAEVFDVVLVDAPCSGTGTIRHNPEIRYNFDADGLGRYSERQLAILESASKVLKAGGRLYYATCSLESEENEDVSDRFLSHNPGFRRKPTGLSERYDAGDGISRTFPNRDGTDGFFVAAFEKLKVAG